MTSLDTVGWDFSGRWPAKLLQGWRGGKARSESGLRSLALGLEAAA